MDKWVVNNFIVQMRSSVIQARVHVLNKLVREIQKLKNKKGTVQQKEKNCRKAERLRLEVLFIKKLGADEMSKYALLCTEDPSDVLQKDSLSSEERAKVRLAAHKSVALQVGIFRKKHVDWELKLAPLLVQLGLKNKYKKNNLANKNENVKQSGKELACISESENELHMSNGKIEKNVSKGDNNLQSQEQIGPHNKMLTKDLERRNKKDSIVEVRRFTDLLKSNSNINDSTEIICNEEDDSSSPAILTVKRKCCEDSDETSNKQMDSQHKVLTKQYEKKKKRRDIAEVRRFADLLESNSDSEDSTEITASKNNDRADSTSVTTDPFFLVGDGSEAGNDEDDVSSEESSKKKAKNSSKLFALMNQSKSWEHENIERGNWNSSVEKNHRRSQWNSNDQEVPVMNRKQRRMMERASAEVNANFASTQNHISHSQPSHLSLKKNHEGKIDFKTGDSAETEILHPSWAAKRKQREQQIVVPFQGKKIKFDDD